MNTVYILDAYTPVTVEDAVNNAEKYAIDNYNIKVTHEQIGVFDTVSAAEKTIKDLISYRMKNSEWYSGLTAYCAFTLTEHELNAGLDDYGNTSGHESVRSYLGNGELNCFSDYDDRCRKPFTGRDDVNKYVKEGDYALYLRQSKFIPVLIDKLAFTKDQWKVNFAEGVSGDVTDDSGLAYIAGYGHDHPFSPYVFPLSVLPYYDIPGELKLKLQKEKEKYLNGEYF